MYTKFDTSSCDNQVEISTFRLIAYIGIQIFEGKSYFTMWVSYAHILTIYFAIY